eukprot:7409642-Alexandrium_andersonii.AAC.1
MGWGGHGGPTAGRPRDEDGMQKMPLHDFSEEPDDGLGFADAAMQFPGFRPDPTLGWAVHLRALALDNVSEQPGQNGCSDRIEDVCLPLEEGFLGDPRDLGLDCRGNVVQSLEGKVELRGAIRPRWETPPVARQKDIVNPGALLLELYEVGSGGGQEHAVQRWRGPRGPTGGETDVGTRPQGSGTRGGGRPHSEVSEPILALASAKTTIGIPDPPFLNILKRMLTRKTDGTHHDH